MVSACSSTVLAQRSRRATHRRRRVEADPGPSRPAPSSVLRRRQKVSPRPHGATERIVRSHSTTIFLESCPRGVLKATK